MEASQCGVLTNQVPWMRQSRTSTPITPAMLCQTSGQFVMSVTIVKVRDGDQADVIAINSGSSVTRNPPPVLVCIGQARYTNQRCVINALRRRLHVRSTMVNAPKRSASAAELSTANSW